jgi:hypothetical protein
MERHGDSALEANGTYKLASDRLSTNDPSTPVPSLCNSVPTRYELIQLKTIVRRATRVVQYMWSATTKNTQHVAVKRTQSPTFELPARSNFVGPLELKVRVEDGSAFPDEVILLQAWRNEDPELTKFLKNRSRVDPDATAEMRELVCSLHPYALEAADASGEDGVPSRLMAAILLVEMINRPRATRAQEIRDTRNAIHSQARSGWTWPWERINRSLGVGQVRLSTAAMAKGHIPFIVGKQSEVERQFKKLRLSTILGLVDELRWPRSNVAIATKLLTTLKNRANRFPSLRKDDLLSNDHAAAVIATEYNKGATKSTASAAQPSDYGRTVVAAMKSPLLVHFFP